MFVSRPKNSITILVFSIFAWVAVETSDFISLMSTPNGDFCITNSSSAMYYLTDKNEMVTRVSSYIPSPVSGVCDFGESKKGNCIEDFEVGDWKSKEGNTLILDNRWELLPIQELPYLKNDAKELSFVTLYEWNRRDNFRISMSLRGVEAHLFLCDNEKVSSANCYWFALQGWKNKFTALRRCNKGDITRIYPDGECKARIEEKKHPEDIPLYMNERSWSHIIIERNGVNLYLKRYYKEKEIEIIHYKEEKEMFEIKYLLGHRKQDDTYCKIHNNYFMQSTRVSEATFLKFFDRVEDMKAVCISFTLNTCPYCQFSIAIMDDYDEPILQTKSIQSTEGMWRSDRLFKNFGYVGTPIRIKIKTMLKKNYKPSGNEFWYLDNVRTCSKKEYRITPKDSRKFSECRMVETDESVEKENDIAYVPVVEKSCPISSAVGTRCIPCNYLESCKNLKICENVNGTNKCYCSPGYTGTECDSECVDGTYGYHCEKKCGFCQPEGKCDKKDGTCLKCDYLFVGSTCHVPEKGQYLINPPKVIKNETNSCEIEWDGTDFLGTPKPKYYLVQYMDAKASFLAWNDYEGVKEIKKMGNDVIANLEKSKMYHIRVLIGNKEDTVRILQYKKLPFIACNTTCNGWKTEDIDIKSTSNSATIKLRLPEDRCDVKFYTYELKIKKGRTIITRGRIYDNEINIPNLLSFTNYTIEFSSNYSRVNKDFATEEGVPSKVRNMEVEESAATSLKLRWEKPEYPEGEIKSYGVMYKRTRGIACVERSPAEISQINTTTNSVTLTDLVPYSVYQIVFYAFNRLHSSTGLIENVETKGLSDFTEDEGLERIKVTYETSEESAFFKFENIQCDKLRGSLTYLIKYSCISDWCSDSREHFSTSGSSYDFLNLTSLQPFSKYKYDILFCRNQNRCDVRKNGDFTTKHSVPAALRDFSVTATGKNFISLRWLQPYPPRGTIKQYKIITKCINCQTEGENRRYTDPQKCAIWPDYYCYQIQDHVSYEKEYSIQVEAIHKENQNGDFTRVAIFNIRVEETKPEKPYNLTSNLSPNNTMTLFWNHPNKTNGVLKYFNIEVKSNLGISKNFSYAVHEERLTYNYTIPDALPPSADITIGIRTQNNEYESEAAEIEESSYPEEPHSKNQISIKNYTETTITISLNIQTNAYDSKVGKYLFVLIDDNLSDVKDPNLAPLEKLLNSPFDITSQLRVVTELNLRKQPTNIVDFTIGNGNEIEKSEHLQVKTVNTPLQKARYYGVTVILLNSYEGKNRFTMYNISTSTYGITKIDPGAEKRSADGGNLAYAFLLLLLLIPIIIGVVLKRKNIVFARPRISLSTKRMGSTSQILQSSEKSDETLPLDTKDSIIKVPRPVPNMKPKLSVRKSTNPPNSSKELYSKPTKIANFEEYVKTSIETGELERQHALFPRGQTQPWKYGSTKINKPKNRYNNLVAYDHSRVILQKIDGDENSDYINANYIHGYNVENAYIATQGPKPTTLTDFWRMIWQENVRHIVMLANVYEGGKKKVEQYWPNINEELTFRDIVIQYKSMEVFANFEYRIFHVTKGNETREIEQLHYSTWPDHGVPLYSQSLVPFLRKLLKIPLSSTSPIVVHCSAGVGRTGTILLADISLRMAAKQGVVDMLNILQKLRDQRPNMVDNVEQYKLAHLVVLESMMGLRTSIPCNEDMTKAVEKLKMKEDHKVQMNYLVETEWQDQAMKSVAEYSEEFINFPEKNRFQEIVPEYQRQILLTRYPFDDPSSSYINAVQVDGFNSPGRFFVTQQPMPNTVGDFWRFINERRISVVLSLNEIDPTEETSCEFWPTDESPELQPVDFLVVKFDNVSKLEYYDIYSLHVWTRSEQGEEHFGVQIVAFKRWPAKAVVPNCTEGFLSFYEEVDAISRGSSNVVVTCFDGVTASGAYVALSFIIEQMKLEHECDVCLAVRNIRHNRKHFIRDENQFLFLYESAVKYINGFQSYANFQRQ